MHLDPASTSWALVVNDRFFVQNYPLATLYPGDGATQPPPPPPPVRATPHNPIPRIRLEAIRGEPRQREQAATQQIPTLTPPTAPPAMPHAPTPRPPRKRTQSQVTPVTRQRHSPATPQPATPQMPTPAIPPGPQTTAAPIVPNRATPPTHTRTLRSSRRPVEACQFTAPPTEEEQPQTPEPSTVNTPASLHETTASPPLKRSQSRAKPDTPQPTPATQKRPTPLGPPVPQAAAAHITAAEDMPA
eukprot:CAMPEP_0180020200 /NCGR_PEP_ID=MMETSP0984-20121128/21577_1 /TAXON_ID=483367 /ORGANISM="non described non described, Strain CCMP 2436" /LENGTH=244 /DNA_ID=CAMNT_0021943913 /DNA_START=352 /DNA_END=1081 /DNA_ORIENTATION=+